MSKYVHLHVVRAVDRYSSPSTSSQYKVANDGRVEDVHHVPRVCPQVPSQLYSRSVANSILQVEGVDHRGNVWVVKGRLLVCIIGRGEDYNLVPLCSHLFHVSMTPDGYTMCLWGQIVSNNQDPPIGNWTACFHACEACYQPQQLGKEEHQIAQTKPRKIHNSCEDQDKQVMRANSCHPTRQLAWKASIRDLRHPRIQKPRVPC
mmetsp:Transcript_104398/g.185640  ORF Transcript_104398/g.185640 Transcript_104398/m.185640 type:complete len:204 (-) Transcript_104398:14-625(-)